MQPSPQVLGLDVRRAASASPVIADGEAVLPVVTFVAFLAGLGLGICVGSLVVALTVMVLAAGVVGSRSLSRSVRRMLDASAIRRKRLERRREREHKLESAGVRLDQLTEL